MKDFSERLTQRMLSLGLNQSSLARKMRTSQSTVSRWVLGSPPRQRMMDDLAEALGVSRPWLESGRGSMLGEDPPMEGEPAPIRFSGAQVSWIAAWQEAQANFLTAMRSYSGNLHELDEGERKRRFRLIHREVDLFSEECAGLAAHPPPAEDPPPRRPVSYRNLD